MNAVNRLLITAEKWILTVMLIIMVFMGLAQIISRFVIESPISWTEAVLTYMFVWTCFLGAAYAVATNAHFSVEVIVDHMPPKLRMVFEIGAQALIIAFSLIVIHRGMMIVESNADQLMAAMPFSMSLPYLSLPVCSALTCIHALTNIVNIAKGGK